jgi:hypothetical protein
MTALPMASAGRFSPLGPLGILALFVNGGIYVIGRRAATESALFDNKPANRITHQTSQEG